MFVKRKQTLPQCWKERKLSKKLIIVNTTFCLFGKISLIPVFPLLYIVGGWVPPQKKLKKKLKEFTGITQLVNSAMMYKNSAPHRHQQADAIVSLLTLSMKWLTN